MGKRKLGQHFLFDKNILQKIVSSFGSDRKENIFEIGAGKGPLTEILAINFKDVFALEYDEELYSCLIERFQSFKNIHIIHGDIMKVRLEHYPVSYAIGNIPYYITTPIIFKLIEAKNIKKFGLLMQKEVADRIVSGEGSKDYGILTIMCNFYCNCQIKVKVKRTSFVPPPKIDSAFLVFEKKAVDTEKAKILKEFVSSAFSMRRKTFYNNIKGIYGTMADEIMQKFNISNNRRAEEIPLGLYEEIADFIKGRLIV